MKPSLCIKGLLQRVLTVASIATSQYQVAVEAPSTSSMLDTRGAQRRLAYCAVSSFGRAERGIVNQSHPASRSVVLRAVERMRCLVRN